MSDWECFSCPKLEDQDLLIKILMIIMFKGIRGDEIYMKFCKKKTDVISITELVNKNSNLNDG